MAGTACAKAESERVVRSSGCQILINQCAFFCPLPPEAEKTQSYILFYIYIQTFAVHSRFFGEQHPLRQEVEITSWGGESKKFPMMDEFKYRGDAPAEKERKGERKYNVPKSTPKTFISWGYYTRMALRARHVLFLYLF
jgi:hypothetical protein